MINAFQIKRVSTLILMPLIATMFFYTATMFWGLIIGFAGLLLGLVVSWLVGTLLLRNPFTQMLEGKGVLALNLDSTGVITPFIMGLKAPYMGGKLKGKTIMDTWDRETVLNLSLPKKASQPIVTHDDGSVDLHLDSSTYNQARFGFFHYPLIFYNAQLHTILTKDFMSEKEKTAFAEHNVLYLNRKVEELTSHVRDFGRYVVELTKPTQSIFQNKWTWIIIGVFVVILILMFAPAVIKAITGITGAAGGAVSQASDAAIRPIG